jgi:diguanylate cyclase (GGDEF)-like protein/PAS domain S-box-containing protein
VSSSYQRRDSQTLGHLARSVADALPVGVIVADMTGSATVVNPAWEAMAGQPDGEWRGRGWLHVLDRQRRERERIALVSGAALGTVYETDWAVTSPALGARVFHLTAMAELDDGEPIGLVATVADVTDERARTERLLDQATHDSLTGLFNRAQFLQFVGHALDRQRRQPRRPAAVLFIDVDDLMLTNDRMGHAAGDRLLRAVAARISAAVRPADVVARYGGDEFTVLCEELGHVGEAAVIAQRVGTAAQAPANGDEAIGVSIGIAIADDPDTDPARVVDDADRAMYRVKLGGRGPASVAPPAVESAARRPLRRIDGLDLVATAAHELRTPLATVTGFATTLRAHHQHMSAAEIEAAFAILDRQATRLAKVLDDVLALHRWHHGTGPAEEELVLAEVMTEALEMAPAPDHVTVTVCSASPGFGLGVTADRRGLVRVVVNLLTNAYRYGGPHIVVDAHDRPGQVVLDIRDDGPGVAPEVATTLFDPFTRGRAAGRAQADGAGLGLAIAREIVEACGGQLDHRPVQPHGASLTIALPTAGQAGG